MRPEKQTSKFLMLYSVNGEKFNIIYYNVYLEHYF